MEQEQARRLGRRAVGATVLALLAGACGRPPGHTPPEHTGESGETGAIAREPTLSSQATEMASLHAEVDASRSRIRDLESELERATSERVAREEEWLRYTKALSQISSVAELPLAPSEPIPGPQASVAATAEGSSQVPPADAGDRDREILVALRSLLVVEQVTGFDLLESGTLLEGSTGPVVLRALDGSGRPVGTLAAERLRLEGSRAARTLTIVFEDGYEKFQGEKVPFDGPGTAEGRGGMRRVELPDVDPAPWIEAMPELFREEDREPPPDDGTWNLGGVRAALNLLLREDVTGGWWRLAALGGVQAGVLRDVQLDQLDGEGRLERKLFADRMEIAAGERGVRIELRDGAQLRGDAKTPFLEGRYRIFLPRASVEAWTKAGIPGLSAAGGVR